MKLPIKYSTSHWTVRKKARMEYIKQQNGLCWFCKEDLYKPPADFVKKAHINKKLFPRGMFDHLIHLHHNHITDDTIGAVHCRCNAYLWQYRGE